MNQIRPVSLRFLQQAIELDATSETMLKTITLSGSINAGKSTVARELAIRLGKTAHIEVDAGAN
jgi:tRNA A37 threonylcarbamoyladenosine biosynthesis protein TsaE